jgi:hypothetical protein
MKIAIITSCTNRKRILPGPLLCASNLPVSDQNSLLLAWKNCVKQSSDRVQADALYCGRGFAEIRNIIKNDHEIRFWIVSAGLGLIGGEEKVPSYNLTISPSTKDSIQNKLINGSKFDLRSWWCGVNNQLNNLKTPLASLIRAQKGTIFVISLPKSYLDFVASDLFSLEESCWCRIRFLGSNSISSVPQKAQELVMPYDERFDGPDSINPGTRADFSQRIARHFVENILSNNLCSSYKEHTKAVQDFLRPMRFPLQVKRTQKSNVEIESIILKKWNDAGGSSAKMLRILRDNELVACEQSRFANIFRQLKSKML